MNPYAKRHGNRDSNHNDVRRWYEDLFCSVADTSGCGWGIPDLCVGIAGSNHWVEVKPDDVDELRASQERFIRDWRGKKPVVIRTHQDVIDHVTNVRQKLT